MNIKKKAVHFSRRSFPLKLVGDLLLKQHMILTRKAVVSQGEERVIMFNLYRPNCLALLIPHQTSKL